MSQSRVSRRQFAKAAAVTAMGACALPASAAPIEPMQAQPPNPAQPAAPTAAQALYDLMRARYGQHLDEAQLQRVRTQIENQIRTAERLRNFPVGQDDPDFAFSPDVD
jgi:hypothetical protein